jgi:hypothetical protein
VVAAAVIGQQPPVNDAPPATQDLSQPTTSTVQVAQTDDTPPPATSTAPVTGQLTTHTTTETTTTTDGGHSTSTDSGVQSHSVDGGHAGVQAGSVAASVQAVVHNAFADGAHHGVVPPPVKLAILDGSSLPTIKAAAHADAHHSGQPNVQPNANGANAPAGDGAAQQGQQTADASTAKVAAVVADSLHGGAQGGPDLNQLIDTLKGGSAPTNDNGGQSGAPQGPAHTGLAYLDLHTGASEAVNAALQTHHHPMVAHDMVSGAHHA